MSNIQAARDTLARWGEGTTPGPWRFDLNGVIFTDADGLVCEPERTGDAALIFAMADPRIRDALDGMLELAGDGGVVPATFSFYARSIAAVILDIDKGLSA